jgi:transcription elongation factor GreA
MSTVQMTTAGFEVRLGSTVSFTDQSAGRDQTFKIVNPHEARPAEGSLSVVSPLAVALLGHRVGDVVEARTPRGVRQLVISAIG